MVHIQYNAQSSVVTVSLYCAFIRMIVELDLTRDEGKCLIDHYCIPRVYSLIHVSLVIVVQGHEISTKEYFFL